MRNGIGSIAMDMRARVHSASLAAVTMFALLSGFVSSANGAVLTCTQTLGINDYAFGDAFWEGLRAQGFTPPKQPLCVTIMLTGEIVAGDANRLEALLQANMPLVSQLVLNSNGGSVNEAMQLGRLARRYYLMTEAPSTWKGQPPHWNFGGKVTDAKGAICASACFFVWLGGVNRMGEVLGIHRPFPSPSEMQRLSPAEADQLYHTLSNQVLTYFAEMDVASHWLNDMMRISSDDIYIFPEKQAVDELEGDSRALGDLPSFAQWKLAKCGALSVQDWDNLQELAWQNAIGTLPKKMTVQLENLNRRHQEIHICGLEAVILARWKLRSVENQN
jgi:hypothetical protein